MRYYVYQHVDPRNGEVRYIGKGSMGRAWACGRSTSEPKKTRKGMRSTAHYNWMMELTEIGFIPDDWVFILHKRLSTTEAHEVEKGIVSRHPQPERLFNVTNTRPRCILTDKQLENARCLRKNGLPYEKIAEEIGTSTMTAYRALTGQTKGYLNG